MFNLFILKKIINGPLVRKPHNLTLINCLKLNTSTRGEQKEQFYTKQ